MKKMMKFGVIIYDCQTKRYFLVPFPFSNFNGKKIRPVLVLSDDNFNESSDDVIVCAITSNIDKIKNHVLIKNNDLEEGKLLVESSIKYENVLKINKELFMKKIGKIKKIILTKTIKELINILK